MPEGTNFLLLGYAAPMNVNDYIEVDEPTKDNIECRKDFVSNFYPFEQCVTLRCKKTLKKGTDFATGLTDLHKR